MQRCVLLCGLEERKGKGKEGERMLKWDFVNIFFCFASCAPWSRRLRGFALALAGTPWPLFSFLILFFGLSLLHASQWLQGTLGALGKYSRADTLYD